MERQWDMERLSLELERDSRRYPEQGDDDAVSNV